MKHVAADLFDAAGEKWIVLVDRYSGYAWTDMKSLILHCTDRKEELNTAIAAWRNMARPDGVSPAQLFYNRRMKQLLPMLPAQAENAEVDIRAPDEAAKRA